MQIDAEPIDKQGRKKNSKSLKPVSRTSSPSPVKTKREAEARKESTASNEHQHFEFGGTPGALGIIFGLPLVIYALYYLCHGSECLDNPLT